MATGQPSPVPNVYSFAPFELNLREAELRKHGIRLKVQEKPLKILAALLEHPAELVTREQLRAQLWEPNTHVDFEHSIDAAVNKLRVTLGDTAEAPRYIETVRGKGYRFVGAVTAGDGKHAERKTRSEPAYSGISSGVPTSSLAIPLVARRAVPRTAFGVASVAMLLIAVILEWSYPTPAKPPVRPAEPHSIAVLPLRNMKPDAETDFLSLALTDAIIHRLSYVREISVRPTASVLKYRNTELGPHQLARELGVETVVAGSYIKEGNDLRVLTEIIPVQGNQKPLRDHIELKFEKLLWVQDRVAESVIHSMELALEPQEVEAGRRGAPKNPLAYEYFLRSNDLALRSNYKGAMDLMEKSVALEPDNASAWACLAAQYIGYARIQGGGKVYEERGWQAFQKALSLDPGNPQIADPMAFHLIEGGEIDRAVPLLRQALLRNVKDALAHWYLSEAYRYGGMLEESLREGNMALNLNPGVDAGTLQNTYLYLGLYEQFLKSLPAVESARTSFYRGLAYLYLKDTSRAAVEFDHSMAMNPALLHAQIGQAFAFAFTGQQAKGIELMRGASATENHDGEMVYKMAQAYAQLGDNQSALRLLRRTVELNFYPYSYFVRDPLLDPIRAEPQYAAVMQFARERQESFRRRFF